MSKRLLLVSIICYTGGLVIGTGAGIILQWKLTGQSSYKLGRGILS